MTVKVELRVSNKLGEVREFISQVYSIQNGSFLVYDPGDKEKDIYPQFRWIDAEEDVEDVTRPGEDKSGKFFWAKPAIQLVAE